MTEPKPLFVLEDIDEKKSLIGYRLFPRKIQNKLYLLNDNGGLAIWNLEDRKVEETRKFKLGTYLANPAFSFENQCFINCTEDEIKFFDLQTGQLKKNVPIPKSKCGYYCAPNYYAIGDHNMNLSLFDLRSFDLMYTKWVARMNSSPQISGWLTVGINESLQQVYTTPKFVDGIEIRHLGDGEKIGSLEDKEFDDYEHEIFLVNEERQLLFSSFGWQILVWDLKNKKIFLNCLLPHHETPYFERKYIHTCAISLKYELLFVGLNYGRIIVFSLKDGTILKDFEACNSSVSHIMVFDELDFLITNSSGNYMDIESKSKTLVWKITDLI